MVMQALHESHNATLAPDGIPLHYGDLSAEYGAGLHNAILLDRSHEGRVQIFGADRFELLNRMSTNKMLDMDTEEGRATLFLTANARIIDRVVAYNHDDHLLVITEPGRGAWLRSFLQKNIFFGDDARLVDVTSATRMFGLHGAKADEVMSAVGIAVANVNPMHGVTGSFGDATFYAVRRKTISVQQWTIVAGNQNAVTVYNGFLSAGEAHGIQPAGGITYNTLRIRAGHPARPELNSDYIPLEIGLWDEVHFAKGCYTGQEIIARMESRARLAKTIVRLDNLSPFVEAPADITRAGKSIGRMTSSVTAPTGEIFALAVLKTSAIEQGASVQIGESTATIGDFVGQQPDFIEQA